MASNPYIEVWQRDFSASNLNTYLRCPRAWEQRYVFGRKDPQGVEAFLGSCFHKAVQGLLISQSQLLREQLSETGRTAMVHGMLNPNAAAEGSKGIYARLYETLQNAFAGYWTEMPEEVQQVAKDTGVDLQERYFYGCRMLSAYLPYLVQLIIKYYRLSDDAMQVEAELKLRMGYNGKFRDYNDMKDDNGIGFVCYLDAFLGGACIDWKTVGKSLTQFDVDTSLQFGLYALAIRQNYGLDEVDFEVHCIAKNKDPKVTILQIKYTGAMMDYVQARIFGILNTIKGTQLFYPQYNYLCKNYCSYKSDSGGCGFCALHKEDE